MSLFTNRNNKLLATPIILASCVMGLTACKSGSDSDSDSNPNSNQSYVKFYNASETSPAVFLTVDENPNSDKNDHFDRTFSGVKFSKASINLKVPEKSLSYELAWQDGASSKREDLKEFTKGTINAQKGQIKLLVLTNTIDSPQVEEYSIKEMNSEQDKKDKVFNVRALNLFSSDTDYELHISKGSETFKQAKKVASLGYKALSANQKFKYDDYIFYITEAGKNEIVYQSDKVSHKHTSQYVMVIRKNTGSGSSPVTLDRVAGSSTVEYVDHDAEAEYRVYNGIQTNELLPNYKASVDFYIGSVDDSPNIADLKLGQRSDNKKQAKGDYGVDLAIAGTKTTLLKNHLLSLEKNSNKTIFLYLDVIDVDTNKDGKNDAKKAKVNTLTVRNDKSLSLYNQNLTLLNLVDSEDFSQVQFYFVRNDETIDTAKINQTVRFAQNETVTLINNTYKVYALATQNSSRVVLASFELTINKDSKEQFLVLEKDSDAPTGYMINVLNRS